MYQQDMSTPYPPEQPQGGPIPYPSSGGFQDQGQFPVPAPYPPDQTQGGPIPYPSSGGFQDQGQFPAPAPYPPDQAQGGPTPYPTIGGGWGQAVYPELPTQPSATEHPGYPAEQGAGYPTPQATAGFSGQGMGGQEKSVSLSLQASNLPSSDWFSKSDPMCVIYIKAGSGAWAEIGRTEMIKNNHNPNWEKKFTVDYHQHTRQPIKFEVYDVDNNSAKLSHHDHIGEAETDLDTIIVENRKIMTMPLISQRKKVKGNPTVTVAATLLSRLTVHLVGHGLKNKDTFGKSDPFYVIRRKGLYGHKQVVYKSEKVDNNLNPEWVPFSMTDEQFCGGDYNAPIYIEVFDWDMGNANDLIGRVQTTLNNLLRIADNGGGSLDLDKRGGKINIRQLTIA